MADNDNHYNVEMEATVFNSEDLVNTCLCTPTRSISDTSTADTINLDEISIDSSDTIYVDEISIHSSDSIINDPLEDPLQVESPVLEIDEERIHAFQYHSFADRYYWHTLNEQPRGEEPYDQMEEDDEKIDIIDEKFDCDPTLDYSFSANDVPSFSDNFWDYWCTDTPDSPSSIGYDCDDGANTAHCLSSIVSESECGSGSECDY